MIAELGMVASAFESAKSIAGIAKSLIGINTASEVQKVAIELNVQIVDLLGKLNDAKMAEYASYEKLKELESKVTSKEAFRRDIENYALMPTCPGAFVYARRRQALPLQPPHYLCPNCVSKEQKAILQILQSDQGHLSLKCPACAMSVAIAQSSEGHTEYSYD